MTLDEFDYALPRERVALYPLAARDQARLLVLHKKVSHHHITDLPRLLTRGSLLIVNDTRVFPARIFGHRDPGGGKVELLCIRPLSDGQSWQCLGQAAKTLRIGTQIQFDGARATILGHDDPLLRVRFEGEEVGTLLARQGHVPLPPYLKRADEPADRERYQTIFASEPGAVAAPTAGLHFTASLLKKLRHRVELRTLTLHVGPGTFLPPRGEAKVPAEPYQVPSATIAAISAARRDGRPIIAVGTTTTRALETFGRTGKAAGETDLILLPGEPFRLVTGLLTNFHMPKSTLLALVCAFGGTKRVLSAYHQALRAGYRMLSYGDAMLVWP